MKIDDVVGATFDSDLLDRLLEARALFVFLLRQGALWDEWIRVVHL